MNITKASLRALSRKRETIFRQTGWTVEGIVEACLESEADSRNRYRHRSGIRMPYACRKSPHKLAKRAHLLVRVNLPRTEFPEDSRKAG